MIQSAMAQFSGMLGEVPQFSWTRGEICDVVTHEPLSPGSGLVNEPPLLPLPFWEPGLKETVGKSHEVLICSGEGAKYEPLTDAPDAYLMFAASTMASRTTKDVGDNATSFVREYGLPRREKAFEDVYGRPAMPLYQFLNDALLLTKAVFLLNAFSKAEGGDIRPLKKLVPGLRTDGRDPEFQGLGETGSLLLEGKLWLGDVLTTQLTSVQLVPIPDVAAVLTDVMQRRGEGDIDLEKIRLVPSFTCGSLLAAMWLQVYLAATEQRLVELRCKGCGIPFEANDRRQEYHDPYCRHATNQRSYYEREKRKKEGHS